MVHSNEQVIEWLRGHCQYDRVLYNALNNHQHLPSAQWDQDRGAWRITARRKRADRDLIVWVAPHPVTREPHHFYRDGHRNDPQTAPIL